MSAVELNKTVPDFTAPATGDKNISLSDFRGSNNVVIYFYPKDSTPGCTTEGETSAIITMPSRKPIRLSSESPGTASNLMKTSRPSNRSRSICCPIRTKVFASCST